jgi:hypothetical protein
MAIAAGLKLGRRYHSGEIWDIQVFLDLFLTKPPPNTWEKKPTHSWLSTFSPAGNAAWIMQLHSSLIAAGNS